MDYGQHADPNTQGCVERFIRGFFSCLWFVVAVVVLLWLVNTFIARAYTIPSGSMEDTIQIDDRVWSEKVTYYFRDIEPGDIVTFDDPTSTADRTLIKRVIAVGGQTVDLMNGVVYVDGQPLDEPYTDGQPSAPLPPMPGVDVSYPYVVPDGYIWVMGDNRLHSSDSRYFGAVDAKTVSGRAIAIYWPLNHIGVL